MQTRQRQRRKQARASISINSVFRKKALVHITVRHIPAIERVSDIFRAWVGRHALASGENPFQSDAYTQHGRRTVSPVMVRMCVQRPRMDSGAPLANSTFPLPAAVGEGGESSGNGGKTFDKNIKISRTATLRGVTTMTGCKYNRRGELAGVACVLRAGGRG